MSLSRISALAVFASVVAACSGEVTTDSTSTALGGAEAATSAPRLRPPPMMFADLVVLDREPPEDPALLPKDAPHVLVPLLLPPPPKAGDKAASPCVVHRGDMMAPDDAPPAPPPEGAKGEPGPAKLGTDPKAGGLAEIDDSLSGVKEPTKATEKPGPTIVQIAIFDEAPPLPTKGEAPKKDAKPPRPTAIATCVLAPDADPRSIPESVLADLRSGDHPSTAVAHVAVVRMPPPPEGGAPEAGPPPGGAPPPDGATKDGAKPPLARGTLSVLPLSELGKSKT
ncbi:MAG: hypothetical protein IPJ34_24445 [Myxococcales bacterium]|nr:hypothetical protein [Myxococcales bacterium]